MGLTPHFRIGVLLSTTHVDKVNFGTAIGKVLGEYKHVVDGIDDIGQVQ